MTIELDIPDSLIETEVKKEIALFLYDKEIFSLGKASELAGVSKTDFLKLLREKNINIKYSIEDVNDDLNNLSQFTLNDSDK